MRLGFLSATTSMLILASGLAAVNAQQPPVPSARDGDRQIQQEQRAPADRFYRDDESDDRDDWRGPRMMERNPYRERGWRRQSGTATGTMAFEMMGPGMGGSGMVRMMMILMDSDGDGSVSLQEFQAGHERMFKAMDLDKDGRLTLEEVQNFGRALRGPRR
jgi:hypothetical protein